MHGLPRRGRSGRTLRSAVGRAGAWSLDHRGPILAVAAGVFVAWFLVVDWTWPDVGALQDGDPESTAFMDRYVERTDRRPDWRPVPWSRISPHLKEAVVVAEDIEFFQHDGFSAHEIEQAIRTAIREREAPRGASTITQQLAKNLWLTPSRNPVRKLKEALLTKQLEAKLDKRRILELYLNVVEFGPGVYGAEAASRTYFGKPASSLNAHEAAQLAASLPRPRQWHPGVQSASYGRRVANLEARMREVTFLDRRLGVAAEPPPDPEPTAPVEADTGSSVEPGPPPSLPDSSPTVEATGSPL